MNQPTAFGINGSKLMVGGENGPEAVAPIETLQQYIAEAVTGQNDAVIRILELLLNAVLALSENLASDVAEGMEGTSIKINNREFARLVKAVTV